MSDNCNNGHDGPFECTLCGATNMDILSARVVAAVRAYQEAFLEHRKASVLVLGGTRDVSIAWDNLQTAIEADAKERG